MEEQEELEVWLGEDNADTEADSNAVQFSPIRLDKFIILNIATFNFYLLIWFYRQWRYVKETENSSIWPGARSLLAIFTYNSLLNRIPNVRHRPLLALAFLAFLLTSRAPDPWWAIGMLMFIPVIPAVTAINRLNSGVPDPPRSFGWRKRNVAPVLVGAPVLFFALLTIPFPDQVMPGERMTEDHLAYVQDLKIVIPGDSIVMFYKFDPYSHEGGGVVLTDHGFGGYWVDQVTELMNTMALDYTDVLDVEVNYATSWIDFTVVRITGTDGRWLDFTLSSEQHGDRDFVRELNNRVERAAPPGGAQTTTM